MNKTKQLLERHRRSVNRLETRGENDSVGENIHDHYHSTGGAYYRLAYDLAALREVEESQEAFRSAHDYYRQSIQHLIETPENEEDEWNKVTYRGVKTLYFGVLSGDTNRQRETAEQLLSVSNEFLDRFPGRARFYYHLKSLAAAIADDPRLTDYLRQAETMVEQHDDPEVDLDSLEDDGDGIHQVLRGIADDDREAIEAGLRRKLSTVDRRFEGEPDFDHRATALTILARQHGHDVDPESPFVPMAFVDAATAAEE